MEGNSPSPENTVFFPLPSGQWLLLSLVQQCLYTTLSKNQSTWF